MALNLPTATSWAIPRPGANCVKNYLIPNWDKRPHLFHSTRYSNVGFRNGSDRAVNTNFQVRDIPNCAIYSNFHALTFSQAAAYSDGLYVVSCLHL